MLHLGNNLYNLVNGGFVRTNLVSEAIKSTQMGTVRMVYARIEGPTLWCRFGDWLGHARGTRLYVIFKSECFNIICSWQKSV